MPKADTKPKFYAVRYGRKPGVFQTWEECKAQVHAFVGAQYKKFKTEEEARAYVAGVAIAAPAAPAPAPAPGDVVDETGWDVVYCDGACKGNGMAGSVAGIGVWWGKNDPRNLSERCPGAQTNNRAELIALARVLETTPFTKTPLLVKTDSKYTMDCFKCWLPKWRENGFRTSTGRPVLNASLIRYIDALLGERALAGQKVQLQHVLGHSGIVGNENADRLANLGVVREEVEERPWAELENEIRERQVGRGDAGEEAGSGLAARPAGTAGSVAAAGPASAVDPTSTTTYFVATGDLRHKPNQAEVDRAAESGSNTVIEAIASIDPEDIDFEMYADALLGDDDLLAELSD